MLKEIAEGMAESGCKVSVYSSHEPDSKQKTERQQWGDAHNIATCSIALHSERQFSILRKTISALYFAGWVFLSALRCRAKVIWVASTPPIIMPFVLRLARRFRYFKYVYHCQDIHPEALVLNGNVRHTSIINLLTRIDNANVRNASSVIVLSRDMRDTIASRPCPTSNVAVVNNFIFESAQNREHGSRSSAKPFRLLFAGSLGRFQNLIFLVQTMIELTRQGLIEVTFMGDGPLRGELESLVDGSGQADKFDFLGHRPIGEALQAMQQADFGLVSLTSGVDRVAYPSKTLMYLSKGLPCIVFADPKTELGVMIQDQRLGLVLEPGDVSASVYSIKTFLNNSSFGQDERRRISSFAKSTFDKNVVVQKLVDEVKGVLQCR